MNSINLILASIKKNQFDYLKMFFFSTISSFLNALATISLIPLVYFLLYGKFEIEILQNDFFKKLIFFDEQKISLLYAIIFFISFFALSSFFKIFSTFYIQKIRRKLTVDYQNETLIEFFKAEWHFFYETKISNISSAVYRDLNHVSSAIISWLNIFASFGLLIFLIIVPFLISTKLTLYILLISVFLFLPFLKITQNIFSKFGKITTEENKNFVKIFSDTLIFFKTIITSNKEKESIQNLYRSKNKLLNLEVKAKILNLSINELLNIFTIGTLILSFFLAKILNISIPELAAIMFAFLRLVPIIFAIIVSYNQIKNCEPSLHNVSKMRNVAKNMRKTNGMNEFDINFDSISFKNVFYEYPNKKTALEDISFKIKRGSFIGFVGESGSGKSTILDLILCLNLPTNGQINFGNQLSTHLDRESVLKNIGYVDSDNHVLPTTIYENLKLFNNKLDEHTLNKILKISELEKFVNSLPSGIHTDISDHGSVISAGQKQRICLARALAKNPKILLLDEATSNLDSETEKKIINNLKNIEDITIIFSTHNEKLFEYFDKKIYLKHGKLILVNKS